MSERSEYETVKRALSSPHGIHTSEGFAAAKAMQARIEELEGALERGRGEVSAAAQMAGVWYERYEKAEVSERAFQAENRTLQARIVALEADVYAAEALARDAIGTVEKLQARIGGLEEEKGRATAALASLDAVWKAALVRIEELEKEHAAELGRARALDGMYALARDERDDALARIKELQRDANNEVSKYVTLWGSFTRLLARIEELERALRDIEKGPGWGWNIGRAADRARRVLPAPSRETE